METTHSVKFLRQRKMMLIMPLLVLPFVTLAFWALGGGRTATKDENKSAGLNLQLPDANLGPDKNEDKLSFYLEADADSLKRADLLRSDPFFQDSATSQSSLMNATENFSGPYNLKSNLDPALYKSNVRVNEQQIYQKINEINRQINQPVAGLSPTGMNDSPAGYQNNLQFSSDVNRMQEMMQMMADEEGTDPEMQQLNGTLDKILDIQHPQRVKEKLKQLSTQQKERLFAVSKKADRKNISLLDTSKQPSKTNIAFYSAEQELSDTEEENGVEAVVHANQILVNGAIIKLRLAADVYISGILIPNGNFVYGVSTLNDERLQVQINSIRHGNSIFPVKLELYDMDGLPGIHIPGAITREVAKQSADNGLQLMELSSFDPSLQAQATAAGISTAKSLLSRKVKQVKVMVKEGYQVILKNKEQ